MQRLSNANASVIQGLIAQQGLIANKALILEGGQQGRTTNDKRQTTDDKTTNDKRRTTDDNDKKTKTLFLRAPLVAIGAQKDA